MKFLNKTIIIKSTILSSVIVSASCTSIDTSKIAPGYKDTYLAMRNAIIGYPDTSIPAEVINEIPYASMLIKIGKGPTGLIILESKLGERYTWLSADEIYLVIENGKIIKTSGFKNNLIDTFQYSLPFSEIIKGEITQLQDFYSYDEPPLKNLSIDFKYKVLDKESIQILNINKDLLLVEEHGYNNELGWKFKNTYWLDEDLVVWKSIQNVSPKLPPINYTLTKKPSI